MKYEGNYYTVEKVDYNGSLMIDKPAQFTQTTAVGIGMVEKVAMKKTKFKADICYYNPTKRHFYEHFERSIYVGTDGHGWVKMYGKFRRLSDYYHTAEEHGYVLVSRTW